MGNYQSTNKKRPMEKIPMERHINLNYDKQQTLRIEARLFHPLDGVSTILECTEGNLTAS